MDNREVAIALSNQKSLTITEIVDNSIKLFKHEKPVIKLYSIRWIILLLYIFYVNVNAIHTMQYAVITDIIVEYYQVSYESVEWTVTSVFLINAVLSFHGGYAVEKLGIRISVIIGAIGTCIATWIKLVTVKPDKFWLILLTQVLIAVFQSYSYPLLPKLVAAWFGSEEISKACSIGLVGVEVGFALSFLVPPLFVQQNTTIEVMEQNMYNMNLTYAICSTIAVALVAAFFKNEPPLPPSIAQDNLLKEKKANPSKILKLCKSMITNRPYILYITITAVNFGVLRAMQVLSNPIILMYYPDAGKDVGIIGLLKTLVTIPGSLIASIFLDKYKKYKETAWIAFGLYFLTLVLFVGTLDQGLEFVYISSVLNGISMGSIFPLTMEVIVELTYPQPENITTGVLTIVVMIITVAYTFLYGHMLRTVGIIWANVTAVLVVFASNLLFFLLEFNLKRQKVQQSINDDAI